MKLTKQSIWILALALLAVPLATEAQTYTFIDLNPSGYNYSVATGIYGSQQVGSGDNHALLWSGAADSAVDLHPSGYDSSYATGVYGSQQVGQGIGTNGDTHALLWSGTAASAVDLHPSGYNYSVATGIYGSQQVGYGNPTNGGTHALLWSGTAASAVDLHPSGYGSSSATGIYGSQQVGYGNPTNAGQHALLWSGTAASAVDLHPPALPGEFIPPWFVTFALGISGSQQVGYGYGPRTFGLDCALLWSGTADSLVMLSPAGYYKSRALGTSGSQQVGYGNNEFNDHALLWSGTRDSVVVLHNFLSSNYTDSHAYSIDANGKIVGDAYNSSTGNWDAILWVLVPEPATVWLLALGLGVLLLGRRKGVSPA
jgi:hypothetical protein